MNCNPINFQRKTKREQKVTPAEFLTLSRPTASTVCQATRSGIHARWVVEPGPVCRLKGQSDHVCAVAMHPIYTIASSAAPQKVRKNSVYIPTCKSGLIPRYSRGCSSPPTLLTGALPYTLRVN